MTIRVGFLSHQLLRAAVAIPFLAAGADALAQTVVASFASGPGNGAYAFASNTPKVFADLIRRPGGGEPAQPVGHLFLPPGEGKVPAVIFVHGSGGIYDAMLDYWPKQFNAAGIALFALDLFGPRGVKSTGEDQSLVPFAADTADAFAALKLLATHPRIDPARIAVLGASRGAITSVRAAIERVAEVQGQPGNLRFAAHVSMYAGGCAGVFRVKVEPGVFRKAPMLWVHGDADDYTPIGACRDYAGLIEKAGTPTEFVTLSGVHHKFDSDDLRRLHSKWLTRTKEDCPLQIDVQTFAFSDRFTGEPIAADAVGAVSKSRCAATGATVEGSRSAREEAAKAILGFLARIK